MLSARARGEPALRHASMIVSTAATYTPRRWRALSTGEPLYVIVAGVAQRGSRWIVSTRRSRSRIGPTLFPDPRNKVRVLTVAVLLTPRIRSVIASAVSILLMVPCGIQSLSMSSNSTHAGLVSNRDRMTLVASSEVVG